MVKYSWILPIKNEAGSLPQLFSEIKKVMIGKSFEIIALNDASSDHTARILQGLASQIPQTKIVNFKKHQGKWVSLETGVKASKGKIVITSDSDLQDDPDQLSKLADKLNQGYDIVSGWRKIRYDPFYKVAISKLGNLLASSLTGHNFKDLNSPFKIYKRGVLENLPKYGSMLRFSMLFASKLDYKVVEVPIIHRPRIYGKSKFGIVKYLRILYDLILIKLLFSGSGRLEKSNDSNN